MTLRLGTHRRRVVAAVTILALAFLVVAALLVGGRGVQAAPRAARRQRAHPHVAPAVASPHRLWSTPVTGYVGGIAADDDGVALFSGGHIVSLLRADDGQVRWTAEVANLVNDPPALGRDVVVVPVDDGVVALARADGQRRWQLRGVGGAVPAIVAPDSVVVGTADGVVALLDASTGDIRWQVARPGRVRVAPAVGSDDIAVSAIGADAGDLAVLDRATGAVRWSAAVPGGSSAPAIVDDLVVIGGGDHHLVARRRTDGAVAWSIPTTAGFESLTRPGVTDTPTGSLVVAADRFGGVQAVDAQTGHVRWSAGLGPDDAILWGAPVVGGDHVAVSGLRTQLTGFLLTDGRRSKSPPAAGMVVGLAAVRDSIVFGLRLVSPGRVERWGW